MSSPFIFNYDSDEKLMLKDDGHYHLNIPTFYSYDRYANEIIDFVFDTGAFITVVVRRIAIIFGFLTY